MAKKGNTGAITIRPTGDARDEYLKIKDLMDAEIAANQKKNEGPRSYSAIFREMGRERYALELATKQADAARVAEEHAEAPGPTAGPKVSSSAPSPGASEVQAPDATSLI